MRMTHSVGLLLGALCPAAVLCQAPAAASPPSAPASPPATKIEAFKPAAGTVVLFSYNELGTVQGISVDVREFRQVNGPAIRGLRVDIKESQYREGGAFVDADEIPELLKGIDALLEVKANPTSFENFEVRYRTRGDLGITAYNYRNQIRYAVSAGASLRASSHLEAEGLRQLRAMFGKAQETLAALPAKNN